VHGCCLGRWQRKRIEQKVAKSAKTKKARKIKTAMKTKISAAQSVNFFVFFPLLLRVLCGLLFNPIRPHAPLGQISPKMRL
jgi:hypothetical protein